jgi:hypothetical protein
MAILCRAAKNSLRGTILYCFKMLDALLWGLEASPVSWTGPPLWRPREIYIAPFLIKKYDFYFNGKIPNLLLSKTLDPGSFRIRTEIKAHPQHRYGVLQFLIYLWEENCGNSWGAQIPAWFHAWPCQKRQEIWGLYRCPGSACCYGPKRTRYPLPRYPIRVLSKQHMCKYD